MYVYKSVVYGLIGAITIGTCTYISVLYSIWTYWSRSHRNMYTCTHIRVLYMGLLEL